MKVHEMKRNAYVIDNTEMDEIILQSYNSTVAIYDKEAKILTLGRHWDYSVTTIKHIRQFLNEYIPRLPYITSATTKRGIEKLIENKLVFYDAELV